MLDPKHFRQHIEQTAELLAQRGCILDVECINQLEAERKQLQTKMQELQHTRNSESKRIGMAKLEGEDIAPLLAKVQNLGDELKQAEESTHQLQERLHNMYASVPNLPDKDCPIGASEGDNVEIRKWGEPRAFDFEVKDHAELGEALGMMDFEMATKLAGSRFVVLNRDLVALQRALTQFMIDTHVQEHGYEEVYVPFMVNRESLYGTGQLPKFSQDLFHVEEHGYALIPTAESPVTNLFRDKIVPLESLPIKLVCHTPCFRSEAGSYGRDTKGMIRQHQFEKVELVHVCHPDQSADQHEQLALNAEKILQKLNLPYRVLNLCTGDIGFCATKTYDLEVWLPGQNKYREISSCSNTLDFQARRMKARYRNGEGKPELVHTLNGSGLAVGRTLLAVMENYQNADGSITVPEVLVPYMRGKKMIN